MNVRDAMSYCRQNYASLASIHSWSENLQAKEVCAAADLTDSELTTTANGATSGGHGCWIGFGDEGVEGQFIWSDGSSVDFVDWSPDEPKLVALVS